MGVYRFIGDVAKTCCLAWRVELSDRFDDALAGKVVKESISQERPPQLLWNLLADCFHAAFSANPLFQGLPGLQNDGVVPGHRDFRAGAWVSTGPSFPIPQLKDAEITHFYPAVFDQRIHNGLKNPVNDPFNLDLPQTRFFGNCQHKVPTGHRSMLHAGFNTESYDRNSKQTNFKSFFFNTDGGF